MPVFRKINILFIIVLFLTNIAFAGVITQFVCDKCRHKFNEVAEGCGLSGVLNTVVYCETCKDFFSVPTEIAFEHKTNKNANIVKPIEKKEFLGEERLVYPCPKCGSEAVVYSGPLCPICKEGTLEAETTGLWD